MHIECPSCLGYGHIDEDGEPTLDRRARNCGDCGGEGQRPRNGQEIVRDLRLLLAELRDEDEASDGTRIPLLVGLVLVLDQHLTGRASLRSDAEDTARAATFVGLNDLSRDCRFGRWIVYLSDGYSRLVLNLRPPTVGVERSLCLPHVLERWDAAAGR